MADGQVSAIEMKGIVRNRTKIGVEDGQAEDLINLRFVNGSWRTSGDGRHVYSMSNNASGYTYTQLFVHTNVYRHLLGVRNNKLWWFASIDSDGVTFKPLKSGNSTSSDAFEKTLPDAPVELTTVHGDLWITQTGHMLTVIDGEDDFEYFIFKKDRNIYKGVEIDVNGKPYDRTLYPYGHIFFNLHRDTSAYETEEFSIEGQTDEQIATMCNEKRITLQRKVQKKNKFSRPFMAIGALELYDGSYMYASAPQLLFPSQNAAPYYKNYYNSAQGSPNKLNISADGEIYSTAGAYVYKTTTTAIGNPNATSTVKRMATHYNEPPYCAGGYASYGTYGNFSAKVVAFDLVCSIENIDRFLQDNKELFSAFCIFITPEQDIYKNENGTIKEMTGVNTGTASTVDAKMHIPANYTSEELRYSLLHSNFYLLKRYTPSTINELSSNNIVDLTHVVDKEIVDIIDIGEGHPTLDIESTSRQSFLPKVMYYYNNRLHIANYIARQYDGYPIDVFCLNNHNVYKTDTRYDDYVNDVIPQLAASASSAIQWDKKRYNFIDPNIGESINYGTYEDPDSYTPYPDGVADAVSRIKQKGDIFVSIIVEVETDSGTQKVSRYVEAFNTSTAVDWNARYVEDLSPILSFPDNRAKKMTISFMQLTSQYYGKVYFYSKEFTLTPHPYLNFACYVTDDLTPIKISEMTKHGLDYDVQTEMDRTGTIDLYEGKGVLQVYLKGSEGLDYAKQDYGPIKVPVNEFDTDYIPNGLKVAKTDNPLFFPVENTYRVGSAKILALCSNAIAVGTGQTGAAPLYVFCADGIYALFVDASGEMAYTNARVIARDVLNNAKSVTPTDQGVAFTTDRGLMMIAGEQVQEIGQPAEGDVLDYANATDGMKRAFGALEHVADLPNELCDGVDFLTYLRDGAIVNYNNNERELIISNPTKVLDEHDVEVHKYPYSYVLDRDGNWSRRDYTADEYVNNYPTSYRFVNGSFYKVDEEGNDDTPLEQRKEADNEFFYLSNIIKLGSIGFKQGARFVVRGYFESQVLHIHIPKERIIYKPIGCYIFGSYDGRKWAMLGGNEKTGKFTDIGCKVERIDVKFLRVCLAGQVTGKTRVDYMEMSHVPSVLNTKIR